MPKQAKPDVNYSLGHAQSHCGPTYHDDRHSCVHFIQKGARIGACEKVHGDIDPKMWCELFKRTSKP